MQKGALRHHVYYVVLTYIMQAEFVDTEGVIIIRKSKGRQHKGQKKKDKRTNNDTQNMHIILQNE
jgi:hypothetical protein